MALPSVLPLSSINAMQYMDRRTMLCAIAVTVLAAASRAAAAGADPVHGKYRMGRVPAPAGVLTQLPGDGNQMALTVDDGASVPVVGAFAQFCHDTGTRLSFFVNGANSSWSVNAPVLRPLVDSGQVQMANHTWSHPYLNRMGLSAVADQIRRNADFLTNTYGVNDPILPTALRRSQRRHRPGGRRSWVHHGHDVERRRRRFSP